MVNHPIVTRIVELSILCSSQVIGESLDSQRSPGHCHRVGNDASDAAGAALVVNDLGPVVWLPSVHRGLIGSRLRLLQLNISGDIVRLSAEELLFVLFGVQNWSIQPAHLLLTHDQLAKSFSVLLSLSCQPSMLR